MPQFIQRIIGTFAAVGTPITLEVPTANQTIGLRVYDRYEPPALPPNPEIVIITIAPNPAPDPNPVLPRSFVLVADSDPLPESFVKYIGTVPFGPDKQAVNIVEVTPTP